MSGKMIAERYELLQQIGQGGMGQIWEGFDHSLRRPVAIKLMVSAHLESKKARARFSREAMAIASLQSPNVVQVFDAGVNDDTPFIVMELLSGEDLHSRLQRVDKMSLSSLVPVVTQIAKALEAANAHSIVHRDLKPANVFLTRTPSGEEVVKILDFGVVAILADPEQMEDNQQLTLGGDIIGTPHYMSPEQVRTGTVDHRSDLWSLAVLAYRALTGVAPFHADMFGALLVAICTDPFAPVTSLLPDLPKTVDDFFNRALAKDPRKRFETASEFARAFASLSNSIAGSAKILVTDDEPDVCTLIQKRFRKQIQEKKYQFVFATDGENALQMLHDHPDIEVVLTDINMPRMDGLTFLGHLGTVNSIARAVVVSAYSELGNIRTAMNRGAFDFLVKPIDFKDLATTIDKTLKHVAELRKGIQSTEENNLLRMSVPPRLVERAQVAGAPAAVEIWPCTVVVIGLAPEVSANFDNSMRTFVRALNSNLEVIIPAIMRRGGTAQRFVGAAIIAVFRGENHVGQALDAAAEIRAQLHKLAQRTGETSPFAVGISIGISTGDVIAAEIGSRAFERIDDALLGTTLQEAVRLQAAAKKNQILVSAATREAAARAFEMSPTNTSADPDATGVFELVSRKSVGVDSIRPSTSQHADTDGVSGVRPAPPNEDLQTRAGNSSS